VPSKVDGTMEHQSETSTSVAVRPVISRECPIAEHIFTAPFIELPHMRLTRWMGRWRTRAGHQHWWLISLVHGGAPTKEGGAVVGEGFDQVPAQERVMRDGCATETEKKGVWQHRSPRKGVAQCGSGNIGWLWWMGGTGIASGSFSMVRWNSLAYS
jgi:hypothetical protein